MLGVGGSRSSSAASQHRTEAAAVVGRARLELPAMATYHDNPGRTPARALRRVTSLSSLSVKAPAEAELETKRQAELLGDGTRGFGPDSGAAQCWPLTAALEN